MDIDAEMRRKIIVSLGAVALLLVAFVVIGASFGGSGLDPTGGLALIGAITVFVLLMAVAGLYLSRAD